MIEKLADILQNSEIGFVMAELINILNYLTNSDGRNCFLQTHSFIRQTIGWKKM